MDKILVIGASGFVGRHTALGLLAAGYAVRCLSRDPARLADLAGRGCEIAQGDMADPAAMARALEGVTAVYVSVNTIVPQPGAKAGRGFMEIETAGLRNIVAGCKVAGVGRLIYVTSLGIERDSPSEWLRERWKIEQDLLASGLAVTVIRPGMICGRGGRGFEMMLSQARSARAVTMGAGDRRMRSIALDDLVYYLVGVLKEPRAYGQCFDVGCDDALTMRQMIDIAASVYGRKAPAKVGIPLWLLAVAAPIIQRLANMPKGAVMGFVDGMKVEGVGDPAPIRAILPRPLLSFRQSVERALATAAD